MKGNISTLSIKLIFIIISLSTLTPIIINWLMFYDIIPTPIGLNNNDWLSFFGSYIGSIISGIATLITLYLTIKYYEKKDDEHKQQIEKQRLLHLLDIQNLEIKEYRPIFSINTTGYSGQMQSMATFTIQIVNIGKHAALNLNISGKYSLNIVATEEVYKIDFRINESLKHGKFGFPDTLELQFEDVIGNQYIRLYEIVEVDRSKANFYYRQFKETRIFRENINS